MMNSCSFDFIYGHSLKLFKVYYSKKKQKNKTTALFVPTSCLQALTSSGPLGLNFCLRIFLDYSGTVNYGLQTKVNSDWWVRNSQMKCLRIFLFFLFQNSIQIKVQDTHISFVGMGFLVCPLWGSSIRVLFLNRACQSDFLPCLDLGCVFWRPCCIPLKPSFYTRITDRNTQGEKGAFSSVLVFFLFLYCQLIWAF